MLGPVGTKGAAMSNDGSLMDEVEAFLAAHPDVSHLDGFIMDLSGNAIGKRYQGDAIRDVFRNGSSLCAAMQLTDVNGECWDVMGLGFSDGDPDWPARPVPGTLALVPWAPERRAQCLMRIFEPDGETPLWFDPRTVLEGVCARFADLSLQPVVAIELEFYLIDKQRDNGRPQPPISPVTGERTGQGKVFGFEELEAFGGVIGAMEAACKAQGLPVTTICTEYGPGQYEINLNHIADPVTAADHAVLMRRAVRETARAEGFDATFMSKPYGEFAGSGLQINLSINDASGTNIFNPTSPDGEIQLGHAVAGGQACFAESMAVFAPNFNGYRRFAPNQFTPVNLDWGENNRSVAFRIPASDAANRRLEHRAAGAEANPYLVTAVVLAGVHHGLANKLNPTTMETGNRSEHVDDDLPRTIWQGLDRFEQGTILKDYFGTRYVEAYAGAKRAEFEAFLADILPREHQWYL